MKNRTSQIQFFFLVCDGVDQVLLPTLKPLKNVMKFSSIADQVAMGLLKFLQRCLEEFVRK